MQNVIAEMASIVQVTKYNSVSPRSLVIQNTVKMVCF